MQPLGAPVRSDAVGALFHLTSEAVVLLEGEQAVAWNGPAAALFGVPAEQAVRPGARPLGEHLAVLLGLPEDAPPRRLELRPAVVVDVTRRCVGGRSVLLLRDVSADVRRAEGLRRLAELSRTLIAAPPTVSGLLNALSREVKEQTRAAYSAVLVLRDSASEEVSHFAYDAPRSLFPARMPRVVGLLAVPVRTRSPARLDDIRGHPAGVGLPGVHPPLGPLLAVPLIAGDEVLGLLAAAQPPGERPFDATDEALLTDLAVHAAVALRWSQDAELERERALVRQEVVDTARHDIRTPVGAGKGYALLLQRHLDRLSPEQVSTALAGLTESFQRIEAFSARLLLGDQVDPEGVQPTWGEVDVADLLAAVAGDAAVSTGRPDAVRVDVQPNTPATLCGDREMVRQVLENLVGNALKHAGSATVTARPEGGHVRFDVRDDGPGIPESEQAQLFDRWTRGSAARRSGISGSGLGLSIVKRLVVAHGGLPGVSSRPGEGATFWVTFPTSRPAPLAEPAEPEP